MIQIFFANKKTFRTVNRKIFGKINLGSSKDKD